jgi:hypothetical protein
VGEYVVCLGEGIVGIAFAPCAFVMGWRQFCCIRWLLWLDGEDGFESEPFDVPYAFAMSEEKLRSSRTSCGSSWDGLEISPLVQKALVKNCRKNGVLL